MKKLFIILVLLGTSFALVSFGFSRGIIILSENSNGQKVFPLGNEGQVLTVDLSKPSGLNWMNPAKVTNPVEMTLVGSLFTLTNAPASVVEIDTSFRTQYDLENATKARLVGFVVTTGTASVGVQYAPGGTWLWLDGISDPTSTQRINVIPLNQKGLTLSGWFPITPDALQSVKLRVVGFGGNGVRDPQISNLKLQVK
jgi:hypothetical protein